MSKKVSGFFTCEIKKYWIKIVYFRMDQLRVIREKFRDKDKKIRIRLYM